MNKFSLKCTSVLFASLLNFSQTATAQVIYGLDQARDFKTMHHGPFTVQIGSFNSIKNAEKVKLQMMSKTKYSVSIHSKAKFHTVVIGPISTAAEVRSIAYLHGVDKNNNDHTVHKTNAHATPQISNKTTQPIALKASTTNLDKDLPAITHSKAAWFAGVDLGISKPNNRNNMTVNNGSDYPAPENLDQYSVKLSNPTQLAVRAGRQWTRDQQWLPAYSLGLKYQHLFRENINGTITEYSLPDFTNYTYSWGISADVLSLYTKIDLVSVGRFMPYVDAGLGVSFNNAMSYRETAIPDITPRLSPGFGGRTKTQLTYNFGAGLDVIATPELIVTLGYDYQAYGRFSSTTGQTTWAGERLDLGNFYTNTGYVGLTYLFDKPIA